MLDELLEGDQLRYFLKELLGFTADICKHGAIIYDDDGDEFYAYNDNDKWNLLKLRGIIEYKEFLAEAKARRLLQYHIQKVLGL